MIAVDMRVAGTIEAAAILEALDGMVASGGRLTVDLGQRLEPGVEEFCRRIGLKKLICSVGPSLDERRDSVR